MTWFDGELEYCVNQEFVIYIILAFLFKCMPFNIFFSESLDAR